MPLSRRLDELEREKEQLRQQLQISRHRPSDHPAIALAPATAGMGVPLGLNLSDGPDATQKLPSLPDHRLSLAASVPVTVSQGNETTRSRSLKGVTVTGEEIDDMYQM